jgi:hypothetical protein
MLAASQEPPLPLKDRLRLSKLTIWFRFDDLTTLRKATGVDVATRKVSITIVISELLPIVYIPFRPSSVLSRNSSPSFRLGTLHTGGF